MSKVIDQIIEREEFGFPCIEPLPGKCKRLMHEVEQHYLNMPSDDVAIENLAVLRERYAELLGAVCAFTNDGGDPARKRLFEVFEKQTNEASQ